VVVKVYFRLLILNLFLVSTIQWGFADHQPQHETSNPIGPVILLNLDGTINPAGDDYLDSGIRRAENQNSPLIVVRLNTPGGLLSTTRTMVQKIAESSVPVVIWVSPAGASATSAGAIIAIGAHFIVMAPGTNIGAAHPVGPQGKDIEGDMAKKAVNDTVAFVTSMAKLRGRNEKVAGQIVGESLSLTADKAVKEKIADSIATDISEILKFVDGKKVIVREGKEITIKIPENSPVENLEMNLGQKFLHVISNPNIAYILMMLGGLGIYIELTSPGALVPGILGAICLLLAFISMQTLPINLGAIALVVLGMLMLVAEVFVPSFGALTVGGLVSLVIGSLFLIDSSSADLAVSIPLLIGVLSGVLAVVAVIFWGVIRVIRKPKEDKFGLSDFEGVVQSVAETASQGRLATGKVRIRGEIWSFNSEDSLQVGDPIQVIEKKGVQLNIKRRNG